MVYAIISIGLLGFIVWSHHMYAVGLDVDTYVSLNMVTYLIIIWLYAGKLKQKVLGPPAISVVGKILTFELKSLIFKQSADNPIVSSSARSLFFKLMDGLYALVETRKRLALPLYLREVKGAEREDTEIFSHFEEPLSNFQISEHLKKHKKPKKDNEFGFYLAGLIEGDGCIGDSSIEISFHMDDVSTAYYIKKRIGYGSVKYARSLRLPEPALPLRERHSGLTRGKHTAEVRKIKPVRYVLRHSKGLYIVLKLINGKLLSQLKIDQLINFKYDKLYGAYPYGKGLTILPKANFDLLTNH